MRGLMKFVGLTALGCMGLVGMAQAGAIVYTFDATAVGAFGAGPYGTVTLTEAGSDVLFSIVLRSDLNFVSTGNQNSHAVFSFNASGVVLTDIQNIRDFNGNSYVAWAPGNNSPFGQFGFGIACSSACTSGGSGGGYNDPLTFKVINASLADFAYLSTGGNPNAYFAADVIVSPCTVTDACTGAIGVTGRNVPEPGTLGLLGLGLAGLGFGMRRRQKI